MQILVTTTGAVPQIIISEFGNKTLVHPIVDYDLTQEFDIDEIRISQSLQNAINSGWITVKDDGNSSISDLSKLQTSNFSISAGDIKYSPETPSNWQNSLGPQKLDAAVDELVDRVKTFEVGTTALQYYNYNESEGESTTALPTYQNKVKLAVTGLETGQYIVEFSAEVRTTATNRTIQVRFTEGINTLNEIVHRNLDVSVAKLFNNISAFKRMSLSGNHTFSIDYRSVSSGNNVHIRRARIKIMRVE